MKVETAGKSFELKLYGQIEENKLSIEFIGTFTDAILYLTSGHLDIKMNDDRTRTYDGFTSAVSVQRGLKPNYTNVVLERVTAWNRKKDSRPSAGHSKKSTCAAEATSIKCSVA